MKKILSKNQHRDFSRKWSIIDRFINKTSLKTLTTDHTWLLTLTPKAAEQIASIDKFPNTLKRSIKCAWKATKRRNVTVPEGFEETPDLDNIIKVKNCLKYLILRQFELLSKFNSALAPFKKFSEFLSREILFDHWPFSKEMTVSGADSVPLRNSKEISS